jgi:serine protease AprX
VAVAAGHGAAAVVPASLLAAAEASPGESFHVIVQTRATTTAKLVGALKQALIGEPGAGDSVKREFTSIHGVAATLTGRQIVHLARHDRDGSIILVPDAPVFLTSLSTRQQWPHAARATDAWPLVSEGLVAFPAIAVVDSGIDASLPDFGSRVVEQVDLTTGVNNSPGDGRGHGTFVAAIAAGETQGYAGAAPGARLVAIDVIDDAGMALTSDVIAACDWILANKDRLGIRVANLSLHSASRSSLFSSPLDRAVERLWFAGVVVVTSAGNYGVGVSQEIPAAPGNDPFVITVGAADIGGTVSVQNDTAAPWSAFGHTLDGFAKPELSAPGRFMVAPLPSGSTLAGERSDRMVEPGYFQLSGTSFAAPVVAGAAAYLLGLHPDWTPDQVKGALMVSTQETPSAVAGSLGVGELDVRAAALAESPPNPNAALAQFLVPDPAGGALPVFDALAWQVVAGSDANWSNASWSDANWSNANWSNANWSNMAWDAASWATASWSDASWADGSSADSSTADASWADGASDDSVGAGGYWLTDDPAFAGDTGTTGG